MELGHAASCSQGNRRVLGTGAGPAGDQRWELDLGATLWWQVQSHLAWRGKDSGHQ